MSLYDDASLIAYPSGYKESKIYAQKPIDGSGDLTFARASSATRLNAEGLIETASVLSTTELVNNGDFATDTGWNKNANWSISGGVAIADGTSSSDLNQGPPFASVGTKYLISFDVVSLSQGSFRVQFGNASIDGNAVGSFSGEVIATSTDRVRVLAISTAIGSIDNVSIKEVITSNVPRIDYTNGCGSLLLEKQSTNLITYSESFDNAYWTKSGVAIIANDTSSPDGTTNADKIYPTSSGNYKHIRANSLNPSSGLYTFSIYAKKSELDHLVLIDYDGGGVGVDFDLTNGVATDNASSAFDSVEMIDFGNGWYRCIATATNMYFYWIVSDSGGLSVTASGTNGLYIWGAMAESNASYPTSYIPTSGTTVTRIQDTSSTTGLSSVINSTEGVLYVEIAALSNDGTTRAISISDGTSNNRLLIYYDTTSNKVNIYTRVGNTNQAIMNFVLADATTLNKIAVKYKLNDYSLWINGVEVDTDISATTFPSSTLTTISFADGNTTSNHFFGKVKQLQVFKTALTDTELATLTTI